MNPRAFPWSTRRLAARPSSRSRLLRGQRRLARLPTQAPSLFIPGTPAGIGTVTTALTSRPLRRIFVGAFVGALLLHLLVGVATSSVRPQVKQKAQLVSAVAEWPEALAAEPTPTPPPIPEVVTSSSLPSPSSTSSSSSSSPSSSSSAGPLLSGLLPGSGSGMAMAVGGGGQGRLSSSTPQATALPTPTLVPARARSRPPPRFPADARKQGRTGSVTLQLHVDDRGVVDDVRVIESSPPGVFDEAAVQSVRTWTFAAATSDGAAVASWVRQTIHFTLDSP